MDAGSRTLLLGRAMLVVLAAAAPLAAQYDAVIVDRDYTGPSIPATAAHEGQKLNVFVPNGIAPECGWPTLIVMSLSAFRNSSRVEQINAGLFKDLLDAGVAVVYASVTVSRGGVTGNPAGDVAYDPANNLYGKAYAGNGVFIPPGVVPRNYPAGLPAPFDDPFRPMPQKDAVMIVQHVRYNAAELGLDPARLAVYGRSAAAITWMWVALGPDRRDTWAWSPAAAGQELVPTRVDAAVLSVGATYFPHYATGQVAGTCFPEVPATIPPGYLQDVPAEFLADSDASYLDAFSALVYGDGTDRPVHLSFVDPSTALAPLIFDIDDPAYPSQTQGQDTEVHTSWSGHAWELAYPSSTRLVATPEAAYATDGTLFLDPQLQTPIADAILPVGQHAADQLAWLLANLPLGFSDLGFALGAAQFSGCGAIIAGGSVALDLTGGPSLAPALLLVAVGSTPVPFKGGTLAAFPVLLQLPLQTDAAGGIAIALDLAEDFQGGGTPLTFQYAFADASAPAGVGLSNALAAVAE